MRRTFALPIRWILIFWIFLMSAIAYLDRVNISIAGKSIAREFNLSNVQLGYIFSAFLLGYALFQAPAGRLADSVGPRLVLTLSVFWWALFTCVITIIPPHLGGALLVMIVARFCLGIGEAVMYPASNCIVSAWIPSTERGIANGLIFAGVGFGAGVTSPLITYLMVEYGWRTAFYVSALIGLIAGAIWYLLARNKPADHPWITPGELDFIQRGLNENTAHLKQAKLPWALILGSRDIWAITLSYFSFGYAAQIFFNWFFIYLSEVRGLNLKQSAFYTMLPFIAMSIGSVLGGVLSDQVTKRYGPRMGRCGVAVVGIGMCAIFIAIGTQAASAEIASIILAGGAGALYLAQSSFWSVSSELGGNSAGSVSGFMNMGAQIGGAVTASLTPAIAAQFGWTAAFLVAAGLCVLGSLAWVGIRQQPLDKSVALETAKL